MLTYTDGVMQAPVTPMFDDFTIDTQTFEKVVEFHIATGAKGLVYPYHKAESLNLTIEDRKRMSEIAVKVVNRRVPFLVHVSALSVSDTVELARHAQKIGADGIVAITPYFWKIDQAAMVDHFVHLGNSVDLPLLAYNSPGYLGGASLDADSIRRIAEQLPNFVGVKEASFNGERFTELCRGALSARSDFTLLTGIEYLLPSVPLGGKGSFSSGGSVCPKLCNNLYDACAAADYDRARELQQRLGRIMRVLIEHYPSSLKGAMALMGRPVGPTRSPMPTASPERIAFIRKEFEATGIFDDEPFGW